MEGSRHGDDGSGEGTRSAGYLSTRACCRKAGVSAILRFAGGLHIVSGRIVIEAELDTGVAARRLRQDLLEIFGHSSELVVMA